jgi:hypothetical protein
MAHKPLKSKKISELQHQIALFKWASLYPMVNDYLFHIPNGGYRNPREAFVLKKQGVKKGISDLFFAFPNEKYHGLWIEMKSEKGVLSEDQEEWLIKMNKMGYLAVVAKGWEMARDIILDYIN